MSAPRPDNSLATALSTLDRLETDRVGREASRHGALGRARQQKRHLEQLKRDYAELRRTTEAICESEARNKEQIIRRQAERLELERRLQQISERVEREAKLRRTKIELEMLEAQPRDRKVGPVVATLAGAAVAAFALALAWIPSGHTAAELGLLEAQADVEAKKIALADRAAELEDLEASVAELGAAAEARKLAAAAELDAEKTEAAAEVEHAASEAPKPVNNTKRAPRGKKASKPDKSNPKEEAKPKRPIIDLDGFGDDPLAGLGS